MKIMSKETINNIIILIVASLIFNIIVIYIFDSQYNKYTQVVNNTINSIINNVYYEYPNISQENILNILNQKNVSSKNILSKYGYDKEINIIKQLENNYKKSTIFNILILCVFQILIINIYIMFSKKNNKKINAIKEYIKQINNKNYILNVNDNGEDELSKLRNELYKITVTLKEAAEISKQEKEQLTNSIADISHQLKTPLTSIRIMLDNINENPDMDNITKTDFIKEISKQIDWISSLVISLLKLAKLDAGVIIMNKQEIIVKELINSIIGNLSIMLEIKNIKIETNISKNAKFIGDYKWEIEAFTNIIKNSIEHSRENCKICINVEDNSLFLKVLIKDEGEGIDKEDVKHIFERFYKSKNSSENSIGIGLPLARAIIEKDNGYISVNSELGKGTTFEIKYIK